MERKGWWKGIGEYVWGCVFLPVLLLALVGLNGLFIGLAILLLRQRPLIPFIEARQGSRGAFYFLPCPAMNSAQRSSSGAPHFSCHISRL